jgi:hypothetical protein
MRPDMSSTTLSAEGGAFLRSFFFILANLGRSHFPGKKRSGLPLYLRDDLV